MLNNSFHSLHKRLLSIFMVVAVVFVAIIARLLFLQVVDGQWLQERAAQQWYRELPINARRGNIYDTHGALLATSFSTFDVYVRARMVRNPQRVALILSSYLGVDFDWALARANDITISESLIRMQVPSDVARQIIAKNESGILLSENSSRFYPFGNMLTQVLGFTTIDNVGQAGIELFANRYLTGVNGFATQPSDVHGVMIDNTLSRYVPSIPGLNVNLTIDVPIQQAAERALVQLMADHEPKAATAIVMNPNTGAILAMANAPSFDLNDIPRDNIEELMQLSKLWPIVDVYEPGSTFKVLTAATALDLGVASLTDTFHDPGFRIVDGERIRCWKHTGHGSQTFVEGLNNSCNSVFVDLALRLGADRLYQSFDRFGFGRPLGVDFMGESGGILIDRELARNMDIARMGFGQAVAVTPLQLINAVASVVNGGNLMQPHFIQSITDANGRTIQRNDPRVINRTVSAETSATINDMLEQVVKQFTGINSFIPGYRIGGKTGTSYKYEAGQVVNKFYSSFIGTFPANQPEYIVLIVVDEPTSGHYYGSTVATPYAKMIFESIIAHRGYQPTNLEEDLVRMERNIEMPNLVGMPLAQASGIIASLGLQWQVKGQGKFVENQTPPQGIMLHRNAIVTLFT